MGNLPEPFAGWFAARADSRIDHVVTRRLTPLAAPMLLEIAQMPIRGGSTGEAALAGIGSLMAEPRSEP